MTVTRWDPFTALARFDREFDELVRRGWSGQPAAARAGFVPPVELVTRGSDVLIRLELPGVDVERDVEVEVDNGRLVIKGERQAVETDGTFLVRELRYGSFRREFALPEGVTAENVEAQYDHGMLEVVVREAVRRQPEPQQVRIMTKGAAQAIEAADAGTA
jgi:HSP20 family protein